MDTLELDRTITIHPIKAEDAERCGQIAFEVYHDTAADHGFPSEQPSVEVATALIKAKLADPNANVSGRLR